MRSETGISIELRTNNDFATAQIQLSEHQLLEELRHRGITVSEYSLHSGPSNNSQNGRNAPKSGAAELNRDTSSSTQNTETMNESHSIGRFA
jgi:predicted deacylase